jgi:hypothetical protein
MAITYAPFDISTMSPESSDINIIHVICDLNLSIIFSFRKFLPNSSILQSKEDEPHAILLLEQGDQEPEKLYFSRSL